MKLRPSKPVRELDAEEVVAVSLSGARVHVDVVVPRTSIKGRMRLVSRAEVSAIRAESRSYLIGSGFPVDAAGISAMGALDEWNAEMAVRHLAIAIRSADDEDEPLSTLEEWRDCDDDQIAAMWQEYRDLERRLDPLGNLATLTEAEGIAIRDASKKKDADLLTSYGSRKLAAFLITSADPPAS